MEVGMIIEMVMEEIGTMLATGMMKDTEGEIPTVEMVMTIEETEGMMIISLDQGTKILIKVVHLTKMIDIRLGNLPLIHWRIIISSSYCSYMCRSGGGRMDDPSQDDKKLEQSVDLPPTYEEAVGESHRRSQNEM